MSEILRGTPQQNLRPPFELCASTRGRLEWEHENESQLYWTISLSKEESEQHLQLDTEAEVA
jgi:hypothetical protein